MRARARARARPSAHYYRGFLLFKYLTMLIRTDFATYPNFPQLPLVCAGDWHGQSIGLINLSAWLQVRAILGKIGERYKARADAFATMSGLASMGLMVIGLVFELVTRGDDRVQELAKRASTWIIVYVYTVVLSMIGLMLSAAAATNFEAKQQKLMITQQRMRLSRLVLTASERELAAIEALDGALELAVERVDALAEVEPISVLHVSVDTGTVTTFASTCGTILLYVIGKFTGGLFDF